MSSKSVDRQSPRLWALLALQLALIALLYGLDRSGEAPEVSPLLEFDASAVDELVIEEPNSAPLRLARNASGWKLVVPGEEAPSTPADADKVEETLDKLADLAAPWPVATSASAEARFEVADDNHQRAVRLAVGGKQVASLLLGTSPGFRRLHVRESGDNRIFEVDLAHFDFSDNADDWIDRSVLAAAGDVTALERAGAWQMTLGDGGWSLTGENASDPATAVDAAKASDLVARFANLRILGAATTTPQGEPIAEFGVTDGQGVQRLKLYRDDGAPEYTVLSDRHPVGFRLAAFVGEQLLQDRAALLPAADATLEDASQDALQDAAKKAAADAGGPSE